MNNDLKILDLGYYLRLMRFLWPVFLERRISYVGTWLRNQLLLILSEFESHTYAASWNTTMMMLMVRDWLSVCLSARQRALPRIIVCLTLTDLSPSSVLQLLSSSIRIASPGALRYHGKRSLMSSRYRISPACSYYAVGIWKQEDRQSWSDTCRHGFGYQQSAAIADMLGEI